jgi:Predicted signal transduction protein with a C-terminal ATPase domain
MRKPYLLRADFVKSSIANVLVAVRSIRIQTRLFGSFIFLSLIPLLITGVFSYNKSSSAIRDKISTYSIQVVDQVGKNIYRELARLEYDSVDIAFSDNIQDVLKNYARYGEWQKYNIEQQLQMLLVKKFSFLHAVSDVLLFTDNKERIVAYGDNTMYKLDLMPEYQDSLFKTAADKNGAPVWNGISLKNEKHLINVAVDNGSRNGILLFRSINDINNGQHIGYIGIRSKEQLISDIYRDVDIGTGADIFVMDSEGIIISSRNTGIAVAEAYENGTFMKDFNKNRYEGTRTFRFESGGQNSLAACSPIENTNWFVVSIIPFSYLNSEPTRIGVYTFVLGILCFILAVLLSLMISKSISNPLNNLILSMNEAEKGNLSSGCEDPGRDEIGEVSGHYNNMLYEVKTLLENVKSKENQKRAAELKALQAQINPHFLSNTLNTVKWLANIRNADNIENLITSLIDLLHVSVGKGDELIKMREEIIYLENYISIQNYKYCDKFKVRFDIQENALDCKVLKFLLQPLVENSIIHGIEPLEGQGLITVKACIYNGNLLVTVTDNGVGISDDERKDIFNMEKRSSKSRFSGIGLPNVEERIKLYFGDQYGIHIESIPYLFTTMELTLPQIRDEG